MAEHLSHHDPYARLAHPAATSAQDVCRCSDLPPLTLKGSLTANPLACFACGLEVSPRDIALPLDLVDELAAWRDVHDALYLLWLDAQEYEEWAFATLKNPRSAVHERALKLIARLATLRPTYYWWFTDQMFTEAPPLTCCPRCSSELTPEGAHRVCTLCRVLVSP